MLGEVFNTKDAAVQSIAAAGFPHMLDYPGESGDEGWGSRLYFSRAADAPTNDYGWPLDTATASLVSGRWHTAFFSIPPKPEPPVADTATAAQRDRIMVAMGEGDTPRGEVAPFEFTDAETRGWNSFWSGWTLKAMSGDAERRGWNRGWARAYAIGWTAWADPTEPEDIPYPQFSGPWEAYSDGWNERSEMEGDR